MHCQKFWQVRKDKLLLVWGCLLSERKRSLHYDGLQDVLVNQISRIKRIKRIMKTNEYWEIGDN